MPKDAPIAHTQSGAKRYPKDWSAAYSDDDKAKVRQLLDWLADGQVHKPGYRNQRSEAKLAKAIGKTPSTVNGVLAGNYPSPPTKHLNAMLGYLEREADRDEALGTMPVVETSVYKMGVLVCRKAHAGRDFGILSAEVGTGKTTVLKQYEADNPGSVMRVRGTPDMNAPVLCRELVERTGAHVHKSSKYSGGTKSEMLRGLIKYFSGRDMLLILDEADKVQDSTMEYIRTISDEAEIGVVLAGTERLRPMVEGDQGRHGQISSRVGFWPPVIRSITRADSDLIVRACYPDAEDEVLDACWQMISGKARVLGKLLRNVDEAMRSHDLPLTGELVIKAGQQLMGLKGGRL